LCVYLHAQTNPIFLFTPASILKKKKTARSAIKLVVCFLTSLIIKRSVDQSIWCVLALLIDETSRVKSMKRLWALSVFHGVTWFTWNESHSS